MKKTIFLAIAILLAFTAFSQSEISSDSTVQDSTAIDTVLTAYIADVQAWVEICGEEAKILAVRGKNLGKDFKDFFDGPAPNTQEGVRFWIDKIEALYVVAGPAIVALLTWILSLFKKDPSGTITKFQNIYNSIRTRYLLLFSGLAVTLVGIVAFKDGGWSTWQALVFLFGFIASIVGGMGFTAFLKMFGINIEAKKVA